MKTILLIIIKFYQLVLSPTLRQLLGIRTVCRYSISCSEFSKQAIQKYGIIKGLKLSGIRLMSCQPWGKMINYGTNI